MARGPARAVTLPAPVKGLNLLVAQTAMKPDEALIMDNYFPEPYRVSLRGGSEDYSTGYAATVESLIPYHGGDGSNKLFAAAGTAIYDATSGGAVGAAAVSSLTNARWQYVQFSAGGGDYVVCVNGADGVRTYSGSAWTTQTITGATAANFVDVASHKSRLWFTSNGSTSAFYLGSGAIAGAATEFDLGPVYRLGGVLAFIVPVSFNSGAGFDDGLCFVSSEGEVALYIGTDPASAATWALSGVFRIGRPLRQRGYTRLNGDALVLTSDGLVSLLSAMKLDPSTQSTAEISYKIDPALNTQITAQRGSYGWQLVVYPQGTRLILNAPQSGDATFHQWTMNTTTNAWCRFKGMNATCWAVLGNNLYYGGKNAVVRADTGTDDNGNAIAGAVKWSWSLLGMHALKRTTMIRPYIISNGAPAIATGINVDFEDVAPSPVASGANLNSFAIWDSSLWDVALWSQSEFTVFEWETIGGLGTWIAPRIGSLTTGLTISFNAIGVMYEPSRAAVIA